MVPFSDFLARSFLLVVLLAGFFTMSDLASLNDPEAPVFPFSTPFDPLPLPGTSIFDDQNVAS